MLAPQIANAGPFTDAEFSCAVPAVADGVTEKTYALGWYSHRYRGELVYHHTGSIRGFRSLIALLPERGLGFAALVNSDAAFLPRALFQASLDDLQGADPSRWTARFFDLETLRRAEESRRYRRAAIELSGPKRQTALTGSYRDDGRFGKVQLLTRDGRSIFAAGPLRYLLRQVTDDTFACEQSCGPLLIDQGPLRVWRDRTTSSVMGFDFQDASFERIS